MITDSERMPLLDPHTSDDGASTMEMSAHPAPRIPKTPRRVGPPEVIPDVDTPLHLTPCSDGWKLKFEGVDTAVAVYPTKKEAMQTARALVASRGTRLVEHRADGTIR